MNLTAHPSAHQLAHRPARIGVVGAGNFGKHHIHTLLGLAEAELVAVVDAQQARLTAITQHHPQVRTWTDLTQALREADVQGWVIASTTASHVPVARMILATDQAVLIEKPLATSVAQGRELEALVKPDSSNVMMGHVLLFNSEFRVLLAQMKGRTPVRYLNAVRHRPITTATLFPGESPLHLTMTHDLYMTQLLMNFQQPSTFQAIISQSSQGQPDVVTAQLAWADGACATLTASFLTPPGMPADGFDRLEVFGDGWAARINANPRPLDWWDEAHQPPLNLEILPDPIAPSGMLAEELRCFCRVVQGRQAVPAGACYADAMQLLAWLEALQTAAGRH